MIRLAVIGKDVSASDSPAIHHFLLEHRFHEEHSYEAVSIPPERFSSQAEALFSRFDGFNVTIPYKEAILPFLKGLEGDAQSFGAVNTVVTKSRTGHNTDGGGFLLMLGAAGADVKGKSVLVLGAGGAGRSCIKTLCGAGAEVFVYERDAARLAEVFRLFGGFTPLPRAGVRPFDLICNCTGIGMHDTVGQLPVVYDGKGEDVCDRLLSACGGAVDLIYTPARSAFLERAEFYRKPTLNGASMLFFQAYLSDCIFLGQPADAAEAAALYQRYREERA